MINWLLNLFRRKPKTVTYTSEERQAYAKWYQAMNERPVYDPSQDDERILQGETETYFD